MAKQTTTFNPQKVSFRGNIGRIEDLKSLGDDKVLNFSMRCPVLIAGVDDQGNKSDSEDKSGFWVEVSCWNKLAEQSSKLLRVGANIVIEGKMSVDSYISDKDETKGQARQSIKVKASEIYPVLFGIEEISFRSSKNKSEQGSDAESPETEVA